MDRIDAGSGILVIGAGIAGLWTALSMAPRPCTVITSGQLGAGSSSWAQGGLAAAVGPGDAPDLHAQDTLAAGAGLCRQDAVEALCRGGPDAVSRLIEAGVPFDRDTDGKLKLGREAAHGRDRIVHVGGDEAGMAIMRTLTDKAARSPQISLHERVVAERLLIDESGIAGAQAWDASRGRSIVIAARAVVLATGGLGGLFAVTTNPLLSQGHGLAMAAEAGATLRDLEFVQFHPTALDVGRDPAPLATEAIRGAGGWLRDARGDRFMTTFHPDAELAPRDIVARGVASAIAETGGAFLDVRGALGRSFPERFATVDRACRLAGLDPAGDLLPVAPAAHYHMGGIRTDLIGRTDVPGLFAVGECASTGVHGANRLASNSLLEAIVFGTRAGEHLGGMDLRAPGKITLGGDPSLGHAPPTDLMPMRRDMAAYCGLLRDQSGLQRLEARLLDREPASVGERLAISLASGLCASALARRESRGAHHRTDHPSTDRIASHSLARLDAEGDAGPQWRVQFEETVA